VVEMRIDHLGEDYMQIILYAQRPLCLCAGFLDVKES
jgi:hypothetical protein